MIFTGIPSTLKYDEVGKSVKTFIFQTKVFNKTRFYFKSP